MLEYITANERQASTYSCQVLIALAGSKMALKTHRRQCMPQAIDAVPELAGQGMRTFG